MDANDNDGATMLPAGKPPRLPPRLVVRLAWVAHRGIYHVTRRTAGTPATLAGCLLAVAAASH